MTKPAIIVSKGGSLYRTRDSGDANSLGESGETEGLIRHLLERWSSDLRIVYYGRYKGSVPDGLTVMQSTIDGHDEKMMGDKQVEDHLIDCERLKELGPLVGFLHTAGYAPTWAMINNPHGANVFAVSVRYTGPMHTVLRELDVPRLVVNNDPRTLPRCQEMSKGWPRSRPAALLDQVVRTEEHDKVVGGVNYRVRRVASRAESWTYHEHMPNASVDPCVCVAHAHFKTGIKNDDEDHHDAWRQVLGDGHSLPKDFFVYGDGWDHWRRPKNWPTLFGVFEGKCSAGDALELFKLHKCGPVVSHTRDFMTGKPWAMMSRGCAPLFFGDGRHPYTYDSTGLLVPLDDESRVTRPGDLKRVVNRLDTDELALDQYKKRLSEKMRPDWSKLDQMLSDLLDGLPTDGARWFDRYGGYR